MPPSKSEAQHKFFQVIAHNPEIAKERGVPQEVAKEYLDADKKAGKFQKSTEAVSPSVSGAPPAPTPAKVDSVSGTTRRTASFSFGPLKDGPTQAPNDQTNEYKTFGF